MPKNSLGVISLFNRQAVFAGSRWLSICVLGAGISTFALADHHNLPPACQASERVNIKDNTSYAIYYDKNNQVVQIEDLAGLNNRKLCHIAPDSAPCPPGYCQVTIGGTPYCKRC